jgi:spermidine synthase
MAPVYTLFFIIFLEGYIVLSSELLAIRQLIPWTGSGTDTISIIIAAVLMPLAVGYYRGGQFLPKSKNGKVYSVRKKLITNLVISSFFLTLGLSYSFIKIFFEEIYFYTGINSRVTLTSIYSIIFLVTPIYLLGQTVPLISNYFSKQRLSTLAGKILFCSTLGSFFGAVFCTLVLMSYLGVHHTTSLTIAGIFLLTLILSKKLLSLASIFTGLMLALAITLNSDFQMQKNNIVSNNKYHMVQVIEFDYNNSRFFRINQNDSSIIYTNSDKPYGPYISYIENTFITPIIFKKDILVIGAGGFAIGRNDRLNNYTFVDIDPELKDTAETYFLKEKLSKNKKFVPKPARAFLNQTKNKYDLIILDTFRGPSGSPEHLVTKEFFTQIKAIMKENSILVANTLMTPNFSDKFSINLDNTIRSVFSRVDRQVIQSYNAWEENPGWHNVVYTMYKQPISNIDQIYTDNKNSALFDKLPQIKLK